MKRPLYIVSLAAILGIMGCHGDARYAADVNSALLTNPTNSVMAMPFTIKGGVACSGCNADEGMAVVVTSALGGLVANRFYQSVGGYSVGVTVRPGDVLNVQISVSKSSGPVMRSAIITAPSESVVIQQDFQF